MSEPSKGFINWLLTKLGLRKGDDKTPIGGFLPRVINVIRCHFRGLLTFIICLAIWLMYGSNENRAIYMYIAMTVLFILKPLAVPTTSLLPIYYLPMAGLLETISTVNFINSSSLLWIVGSMLHLLLNATDLDRMMAARVLSRGSCSAYSLLWKASFVAFFMSIFSNRLQVTSKMIEMITPAILNSQAKSKSGAATFQEVKNIINNAISTSSTIGGFVIVHGAISPLMARSAWTAYNKNKLNWNYGQYTMFTFHVAILMFLFNFICHVVFIKLKKLSLDPASQAAIKSTIQKNKSDLGKITHHHVLAIFYTIAFYAVIMSRRLHFSTANVAGWQPPTKTHEEYTDDVTVVTVFIFILNILPKSYGFCKYVTAKTDSQLPPPKPESAILFWRFVDKNVIYSYFFLFVTSAVQIVLLKDDVAFSKVQGLYFDLKQLMIVRVLICVIAANVMGDAAASFLCVVLFSLGQEKQGLDEVKALEEMQVRERYPYLMLCAVACNLCFTSPFVYNPSYFCFHKGKVPILKMVIYSLPSLIGCSLILSFTIENTLKYTFLNEFATH